MQESNAKRGPRNDHRANNRGANAPKEAAAPRARRENAAPVRGSNTQPKFDPHFVSAPEATPLRPARKTPAAPAAPAIRSAQEPQNNQNANRSGSRRNDRSDRGEQRNARPAAQSNNARPAALGKPLHPLPRLLSRLHRPCRELRQFHPPQGAGQGHEQPKRYRGVLKITG